MAVIPLATWLLFALACVALAATPGPNQLYLVSRTLAQGRAAGFVSLAGTASGLALHIVAAILGLSAMLAAVPAAYDAMRFAGSAYLLFLAWQAWRAPDAAVPGAPSPTRYRTLLRDGAVTGILNPKVALFELAFFPQFIDPSRGGVLLQGFVLGVTQLAVVMAFDALVIVAAGTLRAFVCARPGWGRAMRRLLACVFAGLAVRLLLDERR